MVTDAVTDPDLTGRGSTPADQLVETTVRRPEMSFLRRPQTTWIRRALFQVHLWMGVTVAAYVCLVGVTGAALVFRPEMQKATFTEYFEVRRARRQRGRLRCHPRLEPPGVVPAPPDPRHRLPDGPPGHLSVLPHQGQPAGDGVLGSGVRRGHRRDAEDGPGSPGCRTCTSTCWPAKRAGWSTASAPSALVLMFATGLVVWWPGIGRWRRALRVDFASRGPASTGSCTAPSGCGSSRS